MCVSGYDFDWYVDVGAIDIKQSTHKSVKVFLKACAKEGLMKLKETKGDVVVTGASAFSFITGIRRLSVMPQTHSRISDTPIRSRAQTTQNRSGRRGEEGEGRGAREEGERSRRKEEERGACARAVETARANTGSLRRRRTRVRPPNSSFAVLMLTCWAGQHVGPVHPRLDQRGLHGLRRGT